MSIAGLVDVKRDVSALTVPDGDKVTLPEGHLVRVMQELGGNFTVQDHMGMRYRIEGSDADAIGKPVPKASSEKIEVDVFDRSSVENAVWRQLRKIHDPEIPFNIVDVGLIYEMKLEKVEEGTWQAKVVMTLTAPGCGMGEVLVNDVYEQVKKVPGVEGVDVDLVFDPPWSLDMLSEDAKMSLNL